MEPLNLAGDLVITMTFSEDDLQWIRQNAIDVPAFWTGHISQPQQGDLVRFAGHQFVIGARAWEHTGARPVLRLYMTDRKPEQRPALH